MMTPFRSALRFARAPRGARDVEGATAAHAQNFIPGLVNGAFRQRDWVLLRRMDQTLRSFAGTVSASLLLLPGETMKRLLFGLALAFTFPSAVAQSFAYQQP